MEIVQRHRSGNRRTPSTLLVLKCGHSVILPGHYTEEEARCEWCEASYRPHQKRRDRVRVPSFRRA